MVKRIERRTVIRLSVAGLAILVTLGIWHGYGEWLLGGGERVI